MANVVRLLQQEKKVLQRRLSSLETAITALSGGRVSSGRKVQKPAGVKKHGRVWTPAMRRAAAKRAKARWAKIKKT